MSQIVFNEEIVATVKNKEDHNRVSSGLHNKNDFFTKKKIKK